MKQREHSESGLINLIFVLFVLLAYLVSQPACAVTANVTWVKSFAAAGADSLVNATAVDNAGNIYIAGTFQTSTITLGSTTLTRIGSQDGFIAKLNSSGTVVWAQNIGGSGTSTTLWAITIDTASTPSLYIAGYFSGGSLTGIGVSIIGAQDALAIKLPSTGGMPTWAQNFGGSGATTYFNDIGIDSAATPNVYLAGSFSGGNFYSSDNLTTPKKTRLGTQDALLIKLPGNTGTPASWVQSVSGTGSTVAFNGVSIGVDASSVATVYAVGSFSGAGLSAPSPAFSLVGTEVGIAFSYVASSGSTGFQHQISGAGAGVKLNRVVVDAQSTQSLYFVGTLTGANITSPITVNNIGSQDGIVFKYDATTSNATWGQSFGGSGASLSFLGLKIDTASTPNLYISGVSAGTLTVPSLSRISAQEDAFLMRLPSTGGTTPGWVRNFGGPNTASGNLRSVAIDSASTPNVYVGGYLKNADWTSPAVTLVGGASAYNALTMKLAQISLPGAPTGVSATAGDGQATVSFSVPASDGNSTITSYTVTASPSGATASGSSSPITVTGLSNGTGYTFTVTATNAAGTSSASSASTSIVPGTLSTTTSPPPPPPFLGTGTNGATVPIKITVVSPSTATGSAGGNGAGAGIATATLPAGIFVAPPGALTFSLGVSGGSTGSSPSSNGSSGTISIRLPVAGSSTTNGSTTTSSTAPTVSVAFNVDTRTFTFTAPPVIRSGSRSSVRTKSTSAVIRSASPAQASAPAAPTYQVTAPSALAISTTLSLTGTDASGNSGTIQVPVTLYAPAEIGDLVAASTDLYGNFGTSGSMSPVISWDGQVLSFLSSATNFGINAPTGFNQVMRYSVTIGTVDFMSQNSFIGSLGGNAPYGGDTFAPAVSADGLVLAFPSDAKNIYPIYPIPNGRQIYLTSANATIGTFSSPSPIPIALNGNAVTGTMDKPALSSDGTIIAFESDYNWAPGVSTPSRQIYVKNQTAGIYRLVSATVAGLPGNGSSANASISDDGRFVLFESDATNLISTAAAPTVRQIYLKDMANGTLSLISAGLDGRPGNALSTNGKISGIVPYSAQGMSAVFESDATNLVQNAVTGRQVYRRDVTGQATSLVSADSTGTAVGGSNATLSGDGRFVAYKSTGTPVGKASTSSAAQIYVFDAYANKTALISTDANGLPANAASDMPTISGDGRTIAFTSLATNLDGTSTNDVSQIYLAANPIALPLANGFWVNPNQPGYYAIEQSGNRVWFATFGYNNDNSPNWAFASELAVANNSFSGNLLQAAGGPPLSGGRSSPYIAANLGSTSLSLSGPTQALLSQANTSSTIQRNDFFGGGSSLGQSPGYPETGWWYAPATGQSLFLEVQGTTLTAHVMSYDTSGKAVWYQTAGTMTAPNAYSGTVNLCPNGAPIVGCSNAGAISFGFTSTLAGTITLPGNTKPAQIQRWRF